jgi:hypothetical protein
MNWRGPKTILTLATGILSLIYFATVLWEPEQAPSEKSKNYLRELGDGTTQTTAQIKLAEAIPALGTSVSGAANTQAPADSQRGVEPTHASGEYQSSLDVSSLKATELHQMTLQLTDHTTGKPITDAEVRVFRAARPDHPPLAVMTPDHQGKVSLGHLPRAQYRIEVSADGFHDADPLAVEIPADGKKFGMKLQRAAEVVGFFEGLDGSRSPMGMLRLTHLKSNERIDIRPDNYGQFHSPPLRQGQWHVAWHRHSQAACDPRLEQEIELLAGDRLALTVTLPDGDPALEDGRPIAIRLN